MMDCEASETPIASERQQNNTRTQEDKLEELLSVLSPATTRTTV